MSEQKQKKKTYTDLYSELLEGNIHQYLGKSIKVLISKLQNNTTKLSKMGSSREQVNLLNEQILILASMIEKDLKTKELPLNENDENDENDEQEETHNSQD